MKRFIYKHSFPKSELKNYKNKMLNWVNQFGIFLYLDNNEYASPFNKFECLLAVNSIQNITLKTIPNDWVFGHINYDAKNDFETKLTSSKKNKTEFENTAFFIPEIVIYINTDKNELTFETVEENGHLILKELLNQDSCLPKQTAKATFKLKIKKTTYQNKIKKLLNHIENGDCYEINFCNEAFVENIAINPLAVFNELNKLSPNPFAAFYKNKTQYLMGASPERFIQKNNNLLLSQPIKGTAKKTGFPNQDLLLKTALQESIKENAENIMITDLVRNDLSKICETGSISTPELLKIYEYPQVFQMISTITGILKENIQFYDILKATFPMGSMTGAPKFKVMELIEHYEASKRELFSGSVGYITPQGNFDFNVNIRSLFYNSTTQYLQYQTGGAITYFSNPNEEWEELRLKATAIEKIFQ